MPPEFPGVDDPKRWMDFAKTDLRMAREGVENGYRLEPLCFHAQQAAEKAIKAILIARRISFPKIHDLDKLMDSLPSEISPPPIIRSAKEISLYAEAGRYPHGFEDVTLKDYRRAVELSRAVVDWAEKILAEGKPPEAHEPQGTYKIHRSKAKARTRR
jgi:HEPN domain-containing protein